ncbi:hypothetical protein ES703_78490 [subsurface metagenome]
MATGLPAVAGTGETSDIEVSALLVEAGITVKSKSYEGSASELITPSVTSTEILSAL